MNIPDPRLVAALAEALHAAEDPHMRDVSLRQRRLAAAILPAFLADPRTHEWLEERAEPLGDALALWLLDPPRSYHAAEGMTDYGYNVAVAEIRSILRDPSGESTTENPSAAEIRAAAILEGTDHD